MEGIEERFLWFLRFSREEENSKQDVSPLLFVLLETRSIRAVASNLSILSKEKKGKGRFLFIIFNSHDTFSLSFFFFGILRKRLFYFFSFRISNVWICDVQNMWKMWKIYINIYFLWNMRFKMEERLKNFCN